jgi:AbrB family looped-hinge helix DNA binding protein
MTAVTVSSKYQIVIPREARRRLGITSGTRLQVIEEPTGLRLVKELTLQEIPGLLKGLAVQDDAIRGEQDRPIP